MEHKFRISSLKTIYLRTGNTSAGLAVSRRHANVEETYWTILALCFFSQRLTWAEHLESAHKSKCYFSGFRRNIIIYFQKQILTFEKDKYTHTRFSVSLNSIYVIHISIVGDMNGCWNCIAAVNQILRRPGLQHVGDASGMCGIEVPELILISSEWVGVFLSHTDEPQISHCGRKWPACHDCYPTLTSSQKYFSKIILLGNTKTIFFCING